MLFVELGEDKPVDIVRGPFGYDGGDGLRDWLLKRPPVGVFRRIRVGVFGPGRAVGNPLLEDADFLGIHGRVGRHFEGGILIMDGGDEQTFFGMTRDNDQAVFAAFARAVAGVETQATRG